MSFCFPFWNFHARVKRVKKNWKCNILLFNLLSKTVCLVAVRPHLDEDPFEWIASDCSAIPSWIAFKSALTGISALNPLSSFIALQSYQSIWCKQWIEREHDFVINLAYAERLTLWIKPTKCWLQLPLFQAVFTFAVIFLKLFIFNQIFWLAAISLAFMQIVGAPNKQSYSWPQRDSFQFELFNKYSPQRPDHLDENFVRTRFQQITFRHINPRSDDLAKTESFLIFVEQKMSSGPMCFLLSVKS